MSGRRVVVVRHGRTAYNREDRWQGQLDVPLDDVGRHQAALMAPAVGSIDPVAIVSSDLMPGPGDGGRARRHHLPAVRLDPRLREIYAGQWEGLTGAEVRERFPGEAERIRAGEDIPRGIDGETWTALGERVAAALEDFAAGLPPQSVGVGGDARRRRAGRDRPAPRAAVRHWRILGGLHNCAWAVWRSSPSAGACSAGTWWR